MNQSKEISAILEVVPVKPGCYLMKNVRGKVIYVGKAVNLRSRVRSYFHASIQSNRKTAEMVRRIKDIDWIIVESELEALILENNLIKKYQPEFNVRLKDDKTYPYIKVHWNDPYPKVTVTRRMDLDGSRYFGPYTSVWAVHQTLDLLRRIFPFLTCDREITGQDERACLYFDIKLCSAPCIGVIDKGSYRDLINDLCQFLDGKTEEIVSRLKQGMSDAADDLEFEKAATIRDQIEAIETVVERQKVVSSDYIDSDILALAQSDGDACVQVFFIRGGKLIGRDYFLLDGAGFEEEQDIVAQFIKQFYAKAPRIPSRVLLPHQVDEARIIKQWLRQKKGGEKVEIKVPRRGKEKQLMKMAYENATETLLSLKARWEQDKHRQEQALKDIQEYLEMEYPANRIECYDISNTQGTAAVGSMVVFEQGVPNKKFYRRFNIRSVQGPDDFASMEEVLRRRFNRWKVAQESKDIPGKKIDQAFSILPDLLVVDGGKGQLSRAEKVIQEYQLETKVLIAGLAKNLEEIHLPGRSLSIILPRKSQGLFLLQRIRDEAHRFAISSHRKRRTKKGLASQLEQVPGIGPAKRKALLKEFGSINKIKQADPDDLSKISGITPELASSILDVLK